MEYGILLIEQRKQQTLPIDEGENSYEKKYQ